MTVRPNRPPLPRMAAWSAGIGVSLSILTVAVLAWGMSDVDGDGEASFQEIGAGTKPMRGDSDGDGLSDGWERARGLDPLGAQPSLVPVPQDPMCDLGLGGCEPEPQPEAPPEAAPTVSDERAQMTTGVVAFVAAAIASLAGIFTGRTVMRRGR